MSREEVQKLLGGYATGTLTAEEQQALFAAALDDQELFDALAREQSLRDLLRDPAAKAEVLAALETERQPWYRIPWWRPATIVAAMAGIAALGVLVLWKPAPRPQAVTVAELKRQASVQPEPTPMAPSAPPARAAKPSALRKAQRPGPIPNDAVGEHSISVDKKFELESSSVKQSKDEPPQPPPPAATPAPAQPPASSVQVAAEAPAPLVQQQSQQGQQVAQSGLRGAVAGAGGADYSRLVALDARMLFYGNQEVAAETKAKLKAATARPVLHLGVRYSILRKQANGEMAEVGPETVLAAGESIKLKLTPNDRGSLQVFERDANGTPHSIASGKAEPLQPLEVALPDYPSAGARQLYVQFTRDGQTGASLGQIGGNLVQNVRDSAEKATYVVKPTTGAALQPLVVPITLTYK